MGLGHGLPGCSCTHVRGLLACCSPPPLWYVPVFQAAALALLPQVKLLERYKLQHEVVGAGAEARLRILPRVNAPA